MSFSFSGTSVCVRLRVCACAYGLTIQQCTPVGVHMHIVNISSANRTRPPQNMPPPLTPNPGALPTELEEQRAHDDYLDSSMYSDFWL